MDNEIEDIVKDFEWWIDTLDNDPEPSAVQDFATFAYTRLPLVVDAFKKSQQEQTT